MITLNLKRLLLAASMCCSLATANAAPMDDADAAYQRGDYAQTLNILRPLAAQGNVRAQYNIGVMYRDGNGVTRNYQEALKWYRLAADQGHVGAQYNIGHLYDAGQGVTQSYQEALKWYRLAADQGNAGAQNNIGHLYSNGQGVTQDYQEALKWYRLAADQGYAWAQVNIGVMYENGLGVTKNDQEALKWFQLAAAQGQEDAIANLKSPQMVAAAQNSPTEIPQRMANKPAKGKSSPPQLTFSSSTPKSDGTVELSGRVISDANISEILINGRALEVSLGRDKSFTVTRGLPMGAVTSYRLSVMDEYGQKAEKEINVERAAVQYAEQVAPLNPRKLKAQTNPNAVALIIGIEAYSRLPQAQYADSDATHFYDYANQSLGVPPHKIKLLTDTKANRVDLLLAMRSWMKTEVSGKSDVYIFFAGHGLASADGSKTYLLPADGDRDLLDETSILRDDLIASAKGAKTITMFLDTCYSGGTRTNEILLADARPIAIVPDKSALPSNVTVLAAASGAQLSSTYEAAQQGLFSYWLMKGLEGDADTNKDKKITAGELHEYVARQVGPMAQRRNRQQDPQLMGDSTRVLVSY
jgi:TPR repeat protein